MINRKRKGIAMLLAVVLITAGVTVVSVTAQAASDEGGRVPYQYSVDRIFSESCGDSRISVLRNRQLDMGEPLELAGWVATPEGVAGYRYLWLPAGEQNGEWQDVTDPEILSRPDLAAADIPYTSGHATAGFCFSIYPPSDLSEGYYDVYIRAVDGQGVPCDLVALLNLRYGEPDIDNGKTYGISFPRILREGERVLAGNAVVTAEGITLGPDGRVLLGDLNLASFEQLRITYFTREENSGAEEGRRTVLGLKSSGNSGYGVAGEAYNLTDSLLYAAIGTAGVLEMDLTDVDYRGEVWLTGYLGDAVTVTGIELVYNGYATDRVAAKIFLSGDLVSDYFSGGNHTRATGIRDSVLGDVLRLEVTEKTNDPYIHFDAGSLLREYEINLSADEYKYMVFLYRAEAHNSSGNMNLYLCAGPITGATEDCNQGVRLTADGRWHYVLVDLSQKENWGGIINGWRFDYISSNSDGGDAVEFASVQFFRTYEGAREAASRSVSEQKPYHSGDPAVYRDLSEESGAEQPDFVISPEDSYVATEPVTDADTEESDTAEDAPDTTVEVLAEPVKQGCGSVVVAVPVAALLLAACAVMLRRKD